jgi:predicted signal transduction protein with EAL and GGDEF domain
VVQAGVVAAAVAHVVVFVQGNHRRQLFPSDARLGGPGTLLAMLLAQLRVRLVAESELRSRAENRLCHLAEHDELTDLPNRRALLAHMERRIAAGEPGPVAVLFLVVDRLRARSGFLGHQAGDEFIASLAARLRTHVHPEDFVGRVGGDEFVVSQWLRQADQAALSAKTNGDDGICVFTEEMRAQNAVRNDVELHLHTASQDGSLVMHYQPEVDLRTGQMIGAEALVRWNHPTLGRLQPDSFIDVAESTNFAGELGRWVLHEACRQLSSWLSEIPGLTFHLSVNVSPTQLAADDFVETVAEVLTEHGIVGADLTLEITERAVVGDLDAVLRTLQGLRTLGVQVAIDDFGTGYSSLAQLKALPVNALKIDRGFVRDLGTDPDDLAIVRTIVGLATAFDLDLVAEGVETELAARTLLELGCHKAQGYLFSPAVPAEQTRRFLEDGNLRTADPTHYQPPSNEA